MASEFIIREERHRQAAIDFINGLDLKHPWRVNVFRYVKTRTNPQLALYWRWLGITAKETGNDAEDIHDILKRKFLTPQPIMLGNEEHLRWTTGKLPAADMSEYMTRCATFIEGELGIFLPRPEDLQGVR